MAAVFISGGAPLAFGQDIPAEKSTAPTIVIDPGHGGYDCGARGQQGTTEKEVTLALARVMTSALNSRYNVLLTRTGDYQVEIPDRIVLANNSRANVFVSLHVGGGFLMQYSAITIFLLDAENQPYKSAATLAVPDATPSAPACVKWDEAHYNSSRLSKELANLMEENFRSAFENECRIKNERLIILEGLEMPAVMVEIGCLNNPVWEEQFKNPDRLEVISNSLCETIDQFFQQTHNAAGNNIQ